MAWWDGRKVNPERLAEAGFDPGNRKVALLISLVDELVGFPRHLSQHVGGFVIARGQLSHLVPIENAAMPERTIIQWDKDDLDALGLLKIDVLALGMLSAIRRALDLVSAKRGRPFAMSDITSEDPAVYEMIGHADTVGVFQIESRAQMAMLPRMKPRRFYDLVIEVAIAGRHGASLPAAARAGRAGHLSERGSARRAGAHPGRADLPGAGDAAGGGRRGLHPGRGRQAAPLDGGVAEEGRAAATRKTSRGRSSCRSRASANTAFQNRTPRASRCWSTSPPG